MPQPSSEGHAATGGIEMYRGTRVLAVLGTVLAWFPLAATVLISLAGSLVRGAFLFDYLMPAEFFPVALVGGGLLLWVAVRARLRRRWIAWSLGLAVALLAGVQGLAWALGLASGEADAAGWRLAAVLAVYAAFVAAYLALATQGTLLVRDLRRA
jgi:hypothetical protein